VIELDPGFKRELYAELARHDLALKNWFVKSARQFVEDSRQPPFFRNRNQKVKV
jgi:hypothetical protein